MVDEPKLWVLSTLGIKSPLYVPNEPVEVDEPLINVGLTVVVGKPVEILPMVTVESFAIENTS